MNGRAELPSRWGALQQLQDILLAAGVPMENVTVVVPRNGVMRNRSQRVG